MQSLANITKSINFKNAPKEALEKASQVNLAEFENENTRKMNEIYLQEKQQAMYRGSIYNERGVLGQHFPDFQVKNGNDKICLLKARKITKRIVDGEKFKAVFTGNAGSGKTMLSVCTMNYVYEHTNMSCLFISVPKLMQWERDKAGGTDQLRAINVEKRIENADLVVWDDLGSETAMQSNSQEQATEFTQKVLFNLADSRKGKIDIFTTNNTSKELMQIYNPKLISRMMTKNPDNLIQFQGMDHRIIQN